MLTNAHASLVSLVSSGARALVKGALPQNRIQGSNGLSRFFAAQPGSLFTARGANLRPLKQVLFIKQERMKWYAWNKAKAKEEKLAREAAEAAAASGGDTGNESGAIPTMDSSTSKTLTVKTPNWEDLPTEKKVRDRRYGLFIRCSSAIPLKVGNLQRIIRRFQRYGPVSDVLIPPKTPYCFIVWFANNEGLQFALGRREEIMSDEFVRHFIFRGAVDWKIIDIERHLIRDRPSRSKK